MRHMLLLLGSIGTLMFLSGCAHPSKEIGYKEFEHRASTFAGTAVREDDLFIVGTHEPPVYKRNFLGNWVLTQPKKRKYFIEVRDVPEEAVLSKVTEEWRTIPNNPYADPVEPVTIQSDDPPVLRLRNWLQESEWGKK